MIQGGQVSDENNIHSQTGPINKVLIERVYISFLKKKSH